MNEHKVHVFCVKAISLIVDILNEAAGMLFQPDHLASLPFPSPENGLLGVWQHLKEHQVPPPSTKVNACKKRG